MKYEQDGKVIEYVVTYRTKNKFYLRVKNGVVYVSAPKKASDASVKKILEKYFDHLNNKINETTLKNVIHYNGVSYTPKFFVGKKSSVMINGEEIWIVATKNDKDAFKRVLYQFYKEELEKQVNLIMKEAKMDFFEIIFPIIKYQYLKSMFGNYNRKKHQIKLSTMLCKYDFKFIKYVLYHELTHVLVLNHSKEFYNVFLGKFPKLYEYRRELKKIKYYDYF